MAPPENMMDVLQIGDDRDFVIGRHRISKHLRLDMAIRPEFGGVPQGVMSVLDDMVPHKQRRRYARELCLLETSSFPSGRVALFICFCGDPDCGALTVAITRNADTVHWSEFGSGSNDAEGSHHSDYMNRMGPFTFEHSAYLKTLSAFR